MQWILSSILALLVAASPLGAQRASDPQSPDPVVKDAGRFDVIRPLGRELETNVPDGFTVVVVGDCIISRPLSQYAKSDPQFASVVNILNARM